MEKKKVYVCKNCYEVDVCEKCECGGEVVEEEVLVDEDWFLIE